LELKDLETGATNTWCPGCGNFGILQAFKEALVELGLSREQVVIVSGIGCHGKICNYVNVNSFHVIHGRVLPVLTGIKLSNPELVAVGFAGDGDAYSIGLGHLPHTIRRNIDLTYIVHNNMVFGLTTGQTTPTSPLGFKTRSTPFGSPEEPINPLTFALALGATFVARGFPGRLPHLKSLVKQAILHKGFALIDVLQPCVAFNNTWRFYNERVYELEKEGHDPSDWDAAYKKALEWGEKIPIGLFYREEKPTLRDRLPQLSGEPLVRRPLKIKITKFLEEFR